MELYLIEKKMIPNCIQTETNSIDIEYNSL